MMKGEYNAAIIMSVGLYFNGPMVLRFGMQSGDAGAVNSNPASFTILHH